MLLVLFIMQVGIVMKIIIQPNRIKSYIKAGACAALLATAGVFQKCTKPVPVVLKDTIEFTYPTAAQLLTSIENGQRHSKTIFVQAQPTARVLTEDSIQKFKEVPKEMLDTLKTLPDTLELYYQVYCGKADKAIQKAIGKEQNLVTAGNGVTGRDSITLAGGQKAGVGDYISQYAADSLFNNAIIKKDSILRANITPEAYKKLKPYERDAIITYLYNVSEKVLKAHKKGRAIPESFFECINQGKLAKAQSKFNITPSAKEAEAGLTKRNLIQMLVFGNGKIYDNKHSNKTFKNALSTIKKRADSQSIIQEILTILREYKVDEKNLCETEAKINKFMQK